MKNTQYPAWKHALVMGIPIMFGCILIAWFISHDVWISVAGSLPIAIVVTANEYYQWDKLNKWDRMNNDKE